MEKKIVALDIGGTAIKSGLWDGERIYDFREQDTNAKNGGQYVMDRAKDIIRGYSGYSAIGISTAGQVDSKEGCIRYANENIPGYTGMQIRRILEQEFEVPVAVENDVNAAAVGEMHFGAGRGEENFLCITYGTGVGGAIVINGELYTGSTLSAGEFGGILVHPEDRIPGKPISGCYERYASTTALVREAMKEDAALDSGRVIFEHLERPEVAFVVDAWIDEIVMGMISLIHIFNPASIVVGGGVMAQPYVIEQLEKRIHAEVMDGFSAVRIRQAQLGNQAGLLGAAYLAARLIK